MTLENGETPEYREQHAWNGIPAWDSPRDGSPSRCDHQTLHIIVRNQDQYYCPDCRWSFRIVLAALEPLSWMGQSSWFKMAFLKKHFGSEAVWGSLLKPVSRYDRPDVIGGDRGQGRAPALPEGMTQEQFELLDGFLDLLAELPLDKMLELPPDHGEEPLGALPSTLPPPGSVKGNPELWERTKPKVLKDEKVGPPALAEPEESPSG